MFASKLSARKLAVKDISPKGLNINGNANVKLVRGNIQQYKLFSTAKPFSPLDTFPRRHIGPKDEDIPHMLKALGLKSLDELSANNVPKSIQASRPLAIRNDRGEKEVLEELKQIASKNKILRSFIGMGYHGTVTPPVILRNLLENPQWYTPYTPYQAEISQGRLESLTNFQTMVTDLTGMDIANASLLDEATAAAEAMNQCYNAHKKQKSVFYVSHLCHPQNIEVVKTRAEPLGIKVVVGDLNTLDYSKGDVCGVLIQYPATDGSLVDFTSYIEKVHKADALVCMATDLLALTVLKSPGEMGADIAFGNSQRFGVPMGYGGPHAAFFATKDQFKRTMPGRLIGVSKDTAGNPAYRLSLQTREQHIRRETATSNICTAQALLANTAAMYAIYHGPKGLKEIAERVQQNTTILANGLSKLGLQVTNGPVFDTIRVDLGTKKAADVTKALVKRGINVRQFSDNEVTVALDETTTDKDLSLLFEGFSEVAGTKLNFTPHSIAAQLAPVNLGSLARSKPYLEHPVFNKYHSETEMMRYLKKLENKDLSLNNCMIPLGSCTMKLNAAVEMIPVTWPEMGELHPFVPVDQAQGYQEMFKILSQNLTEITRFSGVSLQPNAGSQGEYAGLKVIRSYFTR